MIKANIKRHFWQESELGLLIIEVTIHGMMLKTGLDNIPFPLSKLLAQVCMQDIRMPLHSIVFVGDFLSPPAVDELGAMRDLVSWNVNGGYFGGELRDVSLGECLHMFCLKVGFLSNLNIVTALISMYGKHQFIDSARRIFDEIDVKKDVVLWNCLIDVYAKTGFLEEALELLTLMKHDGLHPNSSTLAGLLSASSASGALAIGQYVHDYVEEQQLVLDVVLGTAIVDMYAKSGCLRKQSVFLIEWSTRTSGLGRP
ncbi:UNVERIFIED_CONTAM: Pentatricopeptide repeat-containing protein, mitochondrial [Sesamum latifolium]|uniref:Pentatricopeptide repeat-containing protein, mitochondrial n=1 Tax=Sesamum latifolium TaxID=2727402 RepID=A0AAW2W9X5_9LAMI